MKKIALGLMLGMLAGAIASAQESGNGAGHEQGSSDQLGIGIVGNFGGGAFGAHFNPGLSLKLPQLPIYWGIFAEPFGDSFGMSVSGDYYAVKKTLDERRLVDEDGSYYDLKLYWYLGIGGFANIHFLGDLGNGFAFGARIPIGISWPIARKFDLTLGVVPTLGAYLGPADTGDVFYWSIGGELAVRYWFSPGAARRAGSPANEV
ncbi:MAG: hypothetical protein FWD94_06730 [Treponema sp.]|nr:hypothetical protein [Treponema sp.]